MASQKNAAHKKKKKSMLRKWICEVGRQEIAENMYAVWSTYTAGVAVRLSII
jgi:hypothetical protein